MAGEVLHLKESGATPTIISKTIAALRAGKIVVFPTETVYGLGVLASQEDAIKRLIQGKGRKVGHALPVAIPGLSVLGRYSPNIDPISQRLARRCWPGPLTLVLDSSSEQSELTRLSAYVRKAIMPEGAVGYRVPKHDVFLQILKELDEPLVLTSANLSGEPPAVSADMARVGLADFPDLILDDGPAWFKNPSSVVAVRGNKLSVIREGAISRENLKRLTAKIILFVCTGNTCRSPMAEQICLSVIASELHCDISDLEDNGYVVMSAGVATPGNAGASQGARAAMREYGLSLDQHESQPICESLLRFADAIFVMGKAHRDAILAQYPDTNDRLYLLDPNDGEVTDPLGGDSATYRSCAQQIESAIYKRLNLIL
ncbi:MAG: L-threonylcarbamoyladenylate synthase [Planctomycetia bacterium]|nr:L-threonylcarbamoyladenylate synthase [Planctomycetia bacterium]